MRWLTVLTVPRRLDYLPGTLAAIDAAGGRFFPGRKVVFVDGAPDRVIPLVSDGWEVEGLYLSTVGTRRCVWEILHRAALAAVADLLYFEDDVRMSRNSIAAMQRIVVPPAFGFLSFLQMNLGMPEGRGIHAFRGKAFWGNQALKIPGRSLARFRGLHNAPPIPTVTSLAEKAPNSQGPYSGDCWLGEQLQPGIVLPAIVRHIGAYSTIPSEESYGLVGCHAHRAGLHYAGDDADALQVWS